MQVYGALELLLDRCELYKHDGLQLNQRGTFALGQRMLRVAQDYLNWDLGGREE